LLWPSSTRVSPLRSCAPANLSPSEPAPLKPLDVAAAPSARRTPTVRCGRGQCAFGVLALLSWTRFYPNLWVTCYLAEGGDSCPYSGVGAVVLPDWHYRQLYWLEGCRHSIRRVLPRAAPRLEWRRRMTPQPRRSGIYSLR